MSRKLNYRFRDSSEAALSGVGVTNIDRSIGDARQITLFLDVTASGGTSPTLDIVIQQQDPVSGKWFALDTPAAFAQATGVTTEAIDVVCNALRLRAQCTIGGSATPNFTFTLGGVGSH
jgi:hypothetical protein